jgi:hypothetical protein
LRRSRGRYEAHESSRRRRAAAAEERDFFQGLPAVAKSRRPVATGRQLEKAARRLAPFAPAHRGIDVDGLLEQVAAAQASVAAGSLDLDPPQLTL